MNQTVQALREAVEELLYQEAAYMDGHAHDEWFAMWTEDLKYWVPCNEDQYDTSRHISLIFDDRKRLEERIFRLKSKQMHAQSPRSRLSRVVSNIRVRAGAAADVVEVDSTFCLTEARLDQVVTWAGRQTHVLERGANGLKIRQKTVYLVNNDTVLPNLSFLI